MLPTMQVMRKLRLREETRDVDPDVSVMKFAAEFRERHLAELLASHRVRLGGLVGFIQKVVALPKPQLTMYSIDGLDMVGSCMLDGLTATWYMDTTGKLVSNGLCCVLSLVH
jgi:hypothetical protein